MQDFNAELGRALRYGADRTTVDALLHPLRDPNSDEAQAGSHHRLVAADALQDNNREAEARLLRSPHPVYIHNGKVHHADGLFGDANRFRRGYQDALFWSTYFDENHTLEDVGLGLSDMDAETKEQVYEDAMHFYHSHHHLIPAGEAEQAGHDFWLSRNGHGAGFFARPEVYGEHTDHLQEQAEAAGEHSLYADPEPTDNAEGAEFKIYTNSSGRTGWGQPAGLPEGEQ
jgi:hypothetical protein